MYPIYTYICILYIHIYIYIYIYTATSATTDAAWLAHHNTREQCVCPSCEWIDREHHLMRARRLDAMDSNEKIAVIIAVKEGILVDGSNTMEWEAIYGLNLDHYIPGPKGLQTGGGYFAVQASPAVASRLAKEASFVKAVIPLPYEWKESPILSEAIRKGTFGRDSTIADFSFLHTYLAPSAVDTKENAKKLAEDWQVDLQRFNVRVESEGDTQWLYVSNIDSNDLVEVIASIASKSECLWIEPKHINRINNFEARYVTQHGVGYNELQKVSFLYSQGITGSGQVVGVGDSGLDYNSCFFSDYAQASTPNIPVNGQVKNWSTARKLIQYYAYADDCACEDRDHGTHVAGTVAGKVTGTWPGHNMQNGVGVKPVENFNGVAYDAKIAMGDIGVANARNLNVPSNVATGLISYTYQVGARISTHSWGGNSNSYSPDALNMDQYQYDNQDIVILVAAGNSGEDYAPREEGNGSLGTPATAKNVISVGASSNTDFGWGNFVLNTDTHNPGIKPEEHMASFSSQGPAYDGRIKPDVAAPGHIIWSAKSSIDRTASVSMLFLYLYLFFSLSFHES